MKFEPAVYEHAARLIGKTPWIVSRSQELIVRAHQAAFEKYHHTPVVVGIDIYNLEAEAFGGVVTEPGGDGIPALSRPLCDEVSGILDLPDFDPWRSGRLGMILEAGKELKRLLPDAVVKIPVSGPFSLASNITGLETLLCDALTEPQDVRWALQKLVKNQLAFCRAIAEAGLGITFFESAATPPLVSPAMFGELVLPALQELLAGAASFLGQAAACVIGGNTAPILKALLSTGTKYVICPSETDQAEFMKTMAAHPEVMVRINMQPAVFCSHDTNAAFIEADRVMALAGDRSNVCLGSGVLPFEASSETTLAVKEYIESRKHEGSA